MWLPSIIPAISGYLYSASKWSEISCWRWGSGQQIIRFLTEHKVENCRLWNSQKWWIFSHGGCITQNPQAYHGNVSVKIVCFPYGVTVFAKSFYIWQHFLVESWHRWYTISSHTGAWKIRDNIIIIFLYVLFVNKVIDGKCFWHFICHICLHWTSTRGIRLESNLHMLNNNTSVRRAPLIECTPGM